MERHEIMELLGQLKLAGMRAAYDEVVAAGLRAQHSFQRIFGELLLAQLADHRLEIVGLRPAPGRRIRCDGSSCANSFRPRPIVLGATPVAVATAAIPP